MTFQSLFSRNCGSELLPHGAFALLPSAERIPPPREDLCLSVQFPHSLVGTSVLLQVVLGPTSLPVCKDMGGPDNVACSRWEEKSA